MRRTRLAANTGRKKSPFRHHRTTLSGHIFFLYYCIRQFILRHHTAIFANCGTIRDRQTLERVGSVPIPVRKRRLRFISSKCVQWSLAKLPSRHFASWQVRFYYQDCPSLPVDSIRAMMIARRTRERLSELFCAVLYCNSAQWYAHILWTLITVFLV